MESRTDTSRQLSVAAVTSPYRGRSEGGGEREKKMQHLHGENALKVRRRGFTNFSNWCRIEKPNLILIAFQVTSSLNRQIKCLLSASRMYKFFPQNTEEDIF